MAVPPVDGLQDNSGAGVKRRCRGSDALRRDG